MGKGRTTFGMIIAYLVKEVQISSDILKLVPVGLLSRGVSESLIHKKFEQPLPGSDNDGDDPLLRGEFEVINQLLEQFPAAVEAKRKIGR